MHTELCFSHRYYINRGTHTESHRPLVLRCTYSYVYDVAKRLRRHQARDQRLRFQRLCEHGEWLLSLVPNQIKCIPHPNDGSNCCSSEQTPAWIIRENKLWLACCSKLILASKSLCSQSQLCLLSKASCISQKKASCTSQSFLCAPNPGHWSLSPCG